MSTGMLQNGAAGSFVSFSSLPPEIWRLVGEQVCDCRSVAHPEWRANNIYNQIHGPKTLEALSRVCRAFRDIFTPFLNTRRVVQLNRCTVAELDQKPLPAGIRYTRDLEVLLLEFDQKQPQYEVGMNDDFALFIVRMLEAMPQLQSFRSVFRMNVSGSSTEFILQMARRLLWQPIWPMPDAETSTTSSNSPEISDPSKIVHSICKSMSRRGCWTG